MLGEPHDRPRPAASDFVDTVADLTQRRAEGADPETTALVVALLRAGATTSPGPLHHHPRFGHRWPVALQVILTQRAG